MMESISWTEFCSKLKVKDILKNDFSTLHFVREDEKIPDVLRFLATHNITSAPVTDKAETKFLGLVDLTDLVTVVSTTVEAQSQYKEISLEEAKKMIENTTVNHCCDISEQNPTVAITEEDSFMKVMSYFSTKTNLHRVFVIKGAGSSHVGSTFQKGQVAGLLTQSRVVRYLLENIQKLPQEIVHKTVMELQNPHKTFFKSVLLVVKQTDVVFRAFKSILTKEITGTPVVDDSGKFVGSLSTSDLKVSVGGDFIKDMLLTVGEYLKKKNQSSLVTCTHKDTVHTILKKLVEHRAHRIFVLNDDGQPEGVLSLCDVINLFKYK